MKKTEYTCDRCGGGISIYGTGYVTDSSIVKVFARTPEREGDSVESYHLHNHCYKEMLEWMKSGSGHADPG